jgi:hypothetical protein
VIRGARGVETVDWPLNEKFKNIVFQAEDEIKLFKELTTIRIDMPMKEIKPKRSKSMLLKHFTAYHFSSLMAKGEMYELMRIANG